MIRKLLLSLLLVAAGLGVLHLVIGFENFANVDPSPSSDGGRDPAGDRPAGPGIRITGENGGGRDVYVEIDGYFELAHTEERALPGGGTRSLKLLALRAQDSRTLADNRVQLDDVVADIYRVEDHGPEPEEIHIGTLTAVQAFVEIGRDDKGKPSFRKDREIDLRDVVLTSTPEARLRDLRLEVGRLRALQTERGVEFRTPSPDERFSLVLGGDEPTTLTGRGVRGVFPARRTDPTAELEVHVESRTALTRGRATVRARGALDYFERVASGVGRLTMVEDVVIEGLGSGDAGAGLVARGDRFEGRLARAAERRDGRSSRDGSGRAVWRSLQLDGSPARLDGEDLALTCAALYVLPTFDGTPAAFTAEGRPRLRASERSGQVLEFESADRIHVVELPRFLGSTHRATPWPSPWFGTLASRLIVFEGRSRAVDPTRGLEIVAADGLRVLQSAAGASLSEIVGSGAVDIHAADLVVTGSDGFVLRQLGDRRDVRLGPEQADDAHRYSIQRTLADGAVELSGSGGCSFTNTADGGIHIALVSPRRDVLLERGGDSLRAIGTLDARMAPGGALTAFLATGDACEIRTGLALADGRRGGAVRGTAREIESPDGRSFELRGGPGRPASIDRGGEGRIDGERIVVHRLGADRALAVAHGTPAIARVRVAGPDGERLVELHGRRLALLPGLVPAPLLRFHGIPTLWGPRVAANHVVATGDVVVTAPDADPRSTTEARGDELVFRVDDGAGRLRGAAVVRATSANGRELTARAPEILMSGTDPNTQRVTLVPADGALPELTVVGGTGPFRALRIVCDVPVVAEGDEVRIDGRVAVRGLDADGEVDPTGVQLDAGHARMRWDRATEQLQEILAGGEARLRYRGIEAFGDAVRVDTPEHRLDVESLGDGAAGVMLRGRTWIGRLFRIDYEALEFEGWGMRLAGDGR